MIKPMIKIWLKATDGATAIEYSLIAVGIAVAIAAIVITLGADTRDHLFVPVAAVLK